MGNCTGVLSTCCGNDETIRKIDKDNMQKALQSNKDLQSNNFEDA